MTSSKGIWPVELKEQYMRGKYLYKEFMDIVSRESALAYEKYKDLHFSKPGFIGMMERETEYQRYSALIDLYNEFERDKGHFIQYEKKAPDKARGQNRRIEKERRKKECYRLYDELEKSESHDTEAEYADKDGDSLHLCATCRDRDDCDARRRYVTTCSDYDDGDDWDM